MTDNDIIKALECCCKSYSMICTESECPLFGTNCSATISKNSLDLINRQKAEIKEKDEMLSAQADVIKTLERVLKDKTTEIEKSQDLLKSSGEYINGLENALINIKSDAIKEVFEKLNDKSIVCKVKLYGQGKFFPYLSAVTLHDINKLKKEMIKGYE